MRLPHTAMMSSKVEHGGGVWRSKCSTCGTCCRGHAHYLSHLAESHPHLLDRASAGRLGPVFLYQATAKIYHCNLCFYTSRDFGQVWQHILKDHCSVEEKTELKHTGINDGGMKTDGKKEPRVQRGGGEEEERGEGEMDRGGVQEDEGEMDRGGAEEGKIGKKRGEENRNNETEREVEREDTGEDKKEECKTDGVMIVEKEEDEGETERGEEMTERGEMDEKDKKEESKAEELKPCLKRKSPSPSGSSSPSLLRCEPGLFRCSICVFSHKIRTIAVNHVVRKHDSPRHIYDVATSPPEPDQSETGPALADEEEEVTSEMIIQELEATKVLRFSNNKVECDLCGWKARIKRGTKGYGALHLERSHEFPKTHQCSLCGQSFFMSYQLKEHIRFSHKPGRFHCLFCSFRTDFLSGFRRHSTKCNFKDEEDETEPTELEPVEPEPEDKIQRPRRRRSRRILEEDEDD